MRGFKGAVTVAQLYCDSLVVSLRVVCLVDVVVNDVRLAIVVEIGDEKIAERLTVIVAGRAKLGAGMKTGAWKAPVPSPAARKYPVLPIGP